jgi:hypothetical protein
VGLFSGWTRNGDEDRERLNDLPQRYSQFDVAMAWEIRAAGPDTVIAGVIKNLRYSYLDGLEVWVETRDASGKTGARSVCFIIPHQLRQDEIASFSITLPVRAEPGTQLRFSYRYRGTEDGGGNQHSFDVVVPQRQ